MSTYYIFKTSATKTEIKNTKETPVHLTLAQSLRLFGTDYLANKDITLLEITPKDDILFSDIINGHYYSDCNPEISKLLSTSKNLFGFSSEHLNQISKEIVKIDKNGNLSLLGENGWPDLKTLFRTLKKLGTHYVVLRKYETLPDSFLDGDHDIDLLCGNLAEMLLITGATKRSVGISGYQLVIDSEKTDFDIRFVGDNYYDSSWANNILSSRQFNVNGISVMTKENQLFSILYHCLTQKKSISNYYSKEISRLINLIFNKNLPTSTNALLDLLASFMKSHAYTCPKPRDASVIQNKANIKIIKRKLGKQNELLRNIYIKTPSKIRNKLPGTQKFYKS